MTKDLSGMTYAELVELTVGHTTEVQNQSGSLAVAVCGYDQDHHRPAYSD
jgi:hypothetical protein